MTAYRVEHPDEQQIAAYVDGTLPSTERAALQSHLAECVDCRAAVRDVTHIVGSMARRTHRSRWLWVPAAAAAAATLLWVVPGLDRDGDNAHREEALTVSAAPITIAPRGDVDSTVTFSWSSVPYATLYRLRVFDGAGSVLWDYELADTLIALPDSVILAPRSTYYWQVRANTGFDRWSDSEMTEFVPVPDGLP